MSQTIQIVPKFSFPYVETYVNNYTEVTNSTGEQLPEEPIVRYVFPFISSKGIDNVFIKKNTKYDIAKEYGESNYSKYGSYSQALLEALNVSNSNNSEVYCMRVLPNNATYANRTINVYCHGSTSEECSNIFLRKFYVSFYSGHVATSSTKNDILTKNITPDNTLPTVSVSTGETFEYTAPLLRVYSAGRGRYGNFYKFRITKNTTYEKEYGISFNNFEVLSDESGISKIANYIGCACTSDKYRTATFINDIISDQDIGTYPINFDIDESVVTNVYEKYKAWCEQYIADIRVAINATGNNALSDAEKEKAKLLISTFEKNSNIDIDQFDIFNGNNIGTTNSGICIVSNLTSITTIECLGLSESTSSPHDVLTPLTEGCTTNTIIVQQISATAHQQDNTYNITGKTLLIIKQSSDPNSAITARWYFNGTSWHMITGIEFNSDVINLSDPNGIDLVSGDDGDFDNPKSDSFNSKADDCLINAFSGVYDKRILSANRIPVNAFFDACYSLDVKNAIVNLALLRNDCLCYLDCGIINSFTSTDIENLITRYSGFTDNKISKNIQHYYIKEPNTMKRIPVTITYFLARAYADHVVNYGSHIPFVKTYARLTGHIKDSLYPTVDTYEFSLKQKLVENRFNYFETVSDNIFQRACQNTAQANNSDLLEESNITTLYNMKRIIERDITNNLYNFADADIRKDFKDYEMAKFASWVSKDVQSFDIDFRMNEWEADRSILHCYINVTFRGLMKRAILEIDINKRDNSAANSSAITADDETSLVNYVI